MATRGQIKQRKKKSEMTLFEEEPKRTTRKTRRGQRSTVTEAASSAGGARTSRKAMRDKQAEKRAAERAAEAKKPKVTGGRGRVAGKKGIGAKLPAKTATATKPAATKSTTTKAVPRVVAKAPGLTGKVKSILLGKDQKFGGDRGLIDFLPGKSRAKKKVKRTGSASKMSKRKFAGGGMASKMSAKGGARGGKKMPGGMKNGGLAMTTVNGRKVPAFAADGKGSNDLAKKKNGGMMKPKGMRRGGRVMAEPAMPTPPSRRRRGTPTPPPNPNLTAADKKLRASLSLAKRGNATPSAAPSLGDIVRRGGKIPTKTPTPNIDGATRRRGKTPNMPPMPKIPGGMKNGGMAKKGYAKGGMAKKGYSKGGAVRGKPRGVGVALRGYGKALKK